MFNRQLRVRKNPIPGDIAEQEISEPMHNDAVQLAKTSKSG